MAGIQDWYENPTRETFLGATMEEQAQPKSDLQRWALGEQNEQRLGLSMQQARQQNPDLRAEVFNLQGKTGLPAELIQRHLDTVREQVAAKDFDPKRFRQEFPRLAGVMENPDDAALAHDDLDSLQLLERTITDLQGMDARELQWQVQSRTGRRPQDFGLDLRRLQRELNAGEIDLEEFQSRYPDLAAGLTRPGEAQASLERRDAAWDTYRRQQASERFAEMGTLEWFIKAPAANYRRGLLGEELNDLRFRQMMSGSSEAEQARIAELERELGLFPDVGDRGVAGGVVASAGEILPSLVGGAQSALETGIPTGIGAGTAAAVLGQAGPQVATPEELFTVPAATLTGLSVGGAAGFAEYAYRQEAGAAFGEFLSFRDADGNPMDRDTAAVAASLTGAIAAGLESLGFGAIVKTFPGGEKLLGAFSRDTMKAALRVPTVRQAFSDLAKRYGTAWGTETMTEVMQEGVAIIGGELAKAFDEGDFEGATAEQVQERLTETFVQAAQGMALLSAPGPVTNFAMDYGRARQARQTQERMEALGEGARASKLRERLPPKFREIVGKLREDGPIDSVQVPVERWNELFQSQGLDPAEVANEVVGNYDAYSEAVATGGDLVIPLEAYAEKLAGGEFHQSLTDNARFRSTDMTPREAREWMESAPEQVADYLGESAQADPSVAVYDDVFGQLTAAGRDRSTADQEARITQAVFRTLGERMGMDPAELFRQYNVSVTRPMPEVLRRAGGNLDTDLDPIIDRLRAGDIPTQRDAFGPSLMDFLRERGVRDEGGEFAARDVDTNRRAFQRAIVREDGMTPDDAAQAAAEAGYLRGMDRDSVTADDLMQAIDREMRDGPVFSDLEGDTQVQDLRDTLEQLGDYLEELGVDIDAMDNEAIKQALRGEQAQPATDGEAATTLDQGQVVTTEQAEAALLAEMDPADRALFSDAEWAEVVETHRRHLEAEASNPPGPTAEEVTEALRAEFPGLQLALRGNGRVVTLDRIELPEDGREGGTGSQVMQRVTDWADETGRTLALTPSGDFGGDPARLRTFYRRFGFSENTGRGRDLSISEEMVREPVLSFDQSAFHGTPHRFDRFSLDAIGTGEGAQAFGWGLYFAGKREIAEYYRDTLSRAQATYRETGERVSGIDEQIATQMQAYGLALDEIRAKWQEALEQAQRYADVSEMMARQVAAWQERLEALATFDERVDVRDVEGALYQVEIPDDAEMLAWDAPFSQQPEQVQQRIREWLAEYGDLHPMTAESLQSFEDTTGEGIYRALLTDTGSERNASRTLGQIGIPGLRYLDATSRDGGNGTYNYVVWDQERVNVEAVNGQLRQAETVLEQGGHQPRGRISFPQSRRFFNIELLERADLSTFLHESGHLYLEILRDLAQRDDAPQSVRDDFQAILDWLGVQDADSIGTEQHEQWARGFEAYLMEGNAPSAELRDVFARFKAWLVAIYRSIKSLDVELTDEVRGVMDRLVATDEEISAARDEAGYRPLFEDAEAAGMTPEEYQAYRESAEQARSDAEDSVTRQVMREYQRERRQWWRDAKAQMREEVAAEVNQRPEYVAMAVLGRGKMPDGSALPEGMEPFKLSKAALVERYGQPFLKRLPRPYVYSREGGVHPDVAAELFGYRSGDELVQAMVNARPRRQLIDAEVDARMRERYGDMLNDGSLADVAMEAVHNDMRAEVMRRELRALASRARRPASPMSAIREAASRIVAEKRVRDLRPGLYLRAEQKAGRETVDALLLGDYAAATEAKQRQLLNHQLYREASNAREEIDKLVDHAARLNRRPTRERIARAGGEYLAQIDALLARYEFRRGVSLRQIDRRSSLDAWIREQNEAGYTVDVPEAVMNDARVVNYKNVPVEELRGIRDALRQIEHLARTKNRLLGEQRRRDFEATVDGIVASIEASHERTDEPVPLHESFRTRFADWVKDAHAWHTKPEFLFRWLDGDQLGPVWQALFKPIADAESAELDLQRDTTRRLAEIMATYTRQERAQWYGEKRHVPAIGRSMDKASMLSVALNWGNAYNREVVMEGHGWSEAQVQAILSHLDARDWQLVQEIWDLIDSFWPQIKAMEEDLNGIAPEKVQPLAFQAPGRDIALRGGYYPIKYDTRVSFRAFQREEKAGQSLFENSFTRPATRKGHTKERQGSGGQQVRLDLGVLSEHIGQVIHDLTHRRAIIDVNRLVQNDQVRSAIEQTAGRQMYRSIRPWLQAIANEVLQPQSYWERLIGHARTGATVVNMGLKATTAIVQPLGYLNSVDMLGERYAWKGLMDFMQGRSANPWAAMREGTRFAQERSTLMRERQTTFDRDVRDSLQRLTKENRLQQWQRSFFYFTGLMDMAVSVPTWLGAYRKAMEGEVVEIEMGDERAAIDYADSIVRQSQSSGGAKDLARIQRGGQVQRSFVMFYSYFSALYNQFARRFSQVKRGDISLPRFAASMLYLWFVPAILGELIAGRGPEDDEEWAAWAAKQNILYPMGTMVGLRDVGNAVLTPYGYDASPAYDAFGMTSRTLKIPFKAADDEQEVTRADVKAAVLTAGYWGKLPSRQAWITGEYLYDFATGQDNPESPQEFVRNLFFSRPADER